ncbi:HNH endonuclease [Rarobacter faecitabidus]|uniref:HNH endonuclease n=1 Tax=Rarobacter faecitabidus TaxID=13243 RepID=A0A542ZE16_RARFA|nr:HNH endonuclease [Rarobacter faecitabidus]
MLDEWDPRRGRQGRPWRRLVAQVCPPGSLCEVPACRKPTREIIFGLRPRHPLGPSVDHIVPLEDGGHPTALWNLRPAHYGCNSARANSPRLPQLMPRSSVRLPLTRDDSRIVVVLAGPPGAGKTTAARQSGLEVFDRDDRQWHTERGFQDALRDLGRRSDARAVVIRSAPTSRARARWSALTDATACYVLTTALDECVRRINQRGRPGRHREIAAAATWFERFDTRDGVETFEGWSIDRPQRPSSGVRIPVDGAVRPRSGVRLPVEQ